MQLVLRPRRALTAPQLLACFGVVALLSLVTALFSWLHGNAFAPLFTLLELALVAGCLRQVWRQGDRCEVVAIAADRVEVRLAADGPVVFQAHPYWTRVVQDADGRVALGSQGRSVVIGAFLGASERQGLAQRLRSLLDRASGRAGQVSTVGCL